MSHPPSMATISCGRLAAIRGGQVVRHPGTEVRPKPGKAVSSTVVVPSRWYSAWMPGDASNIPESPMIMIDVGAAAGGSTVVAGSRTPGEGAGAAGGGARWVTRATLRPTVTLA